MRPEWQPYVVANAAGWLLAAILAWIAVTNFDVPAWLAAAAAAGWVVKDLLLFPVMKRFYVSDPPERRMIGERGVVLGALDPSGIVRVRGEIWQARVADGAPSLAAGTPVRVADVQGMRVTVERDSW